MDAAKYNLAQRMDSLRASEIRELLKLTQRPEVISFAGGLPAAELFPAQEMAEISRRILETEGCKALQYSATEGDPTLRQQIAERMNAKQQTQVSADDILITSGSQQGLEFSAKIFIDEGDVILCESPTYLGAINAFRSYQPRFVEVETDDNGMVPEALEKALQENDRVKFIYAIPDFQNPSGRTWSLERRQALIDLSLKYGVVVLEDSPYAELRFEGEPLPALKALDKNDMVIFLGTFSKVFCPGLRCAWLAAPAPLLQRYIMVKQGADLHTSTLIQRQVASFVELHGLDDNISKVVAVYRRRRQLMLDVFAEELPKQATFTKPEGGMFLWITLPEDKSGRDLLEKCLEQNVAFVPGGAFFPNGGRENTARVNFSCMPDEKIVEGAHRFCKVMKEFLG